MKILLLFGAFAPKNVIGAVRPTYIAKYLNQFGHDVTVLADIDEGLSQDNELFNCVKDIAIIRYGKKRNVVKKEMQVKEKSNSVLKRLKKKVTSGIIGRIYDSVKLYKEGLRGYKDIMKEIDKIDVGEYDLIIASYLPISVLIAAKKISRKYKVDWIADFRDVMNFGSRWINNLFLRNICKSAKACVFISEGLLEEFKKYNPKKSYVVYNGFENIPSRLQSKEYIDFVNKNNFSKDVLYFCYTGTLFGGKRNLEPLFEYVNQIGSKEEIKEHVRICYAGHDGEIIKKMARNKGLEDIVIDYGYLGKDSAYALQTLCDCFVVAVWNTKNETGQLTGKFFDGVCVKKPIIGIASGNIPQCELKTVINRYKLGYCFEEAMGKIEIEGVDYLKKMYNQKIYDDGIPTVKEEAYNAFLYSNIIKKYNEIIGDIK